ncbi:hypothetical protein B7P43_G10606 [Cryptotermes secundus]|uniref:Uncharacterized protein n=1 Tax=Cryptotermes secundus TaxID=105785 RepID=A0A2J7QXB9_9NEOP|nr:hypothetical protein B7P43_G10606 [Cryptotermes secundus]
MRTALEARRVFGGISVVCARVFSMASDKLASIPEVDIDSDGTFKYVLIKVYGAKKPSSPEEVKTIVRGFKWGEYHGIVSGALSCVGVMAGLYMVVVEKKSLLLLGIEPLSSSPKPVMNVSHLII